MTTDKPQESTESEGAHVAPDPLAMSVASTAEDYTAAKLTPDPGSDIGVAIPPGGGVVELPDTADKDHHGAVTYEQLSLPEEAPETEPEVKPRGHEGPMGSTSPR
jgi:hypothetical protein